MVRDRNVYRCQQCGFASPKPGTCPDCKRMTGDLMALVEERAAPEPGGRRIGLSSSRPRALSDITMEHTDRLRTGIGELDRVLGGGVVPGSLVLIGGDPGIGKSTLLIQAARALATAAPPVLYVSAEESAAQVKLRAERLGISSDGLLLWTETDLVTVEAELDTVKPKVLIIDSIQTVFLPTLESDPGVFRRNERGLLEFKTLSVCSLAERPRHVLGSVIFAGLEGTRPLLLELQALVAPASFGTPRRTVLGADYNRVCLLLAVLEKRVGMPLASQDVFVNVAGGGRVTEPAADLGIVLAAASSYLDRPVPGDVVVLGEVGLTGEVRAVTGLDIRLKEAAALGFRRSVVPKSSVVAGEKFPLDVRGVATVNEALEALLG